jgi:hypothetical protein
MALQSSSERLRAGWDHFEREGSTVAHMRRHLAAPDRYTGFQFGWRATLLFAGLVAAGAPFLVLIAWAAGWVR